MTYIIYLSPSALNDIQEALDYYNSKIDKLGYGFVEEVDLAMQDVARMPTAYGYRYKNVRAKQLRKFPFLVYFTFEESLSRIHVLRIFHTSQHPFWQKKS